MVSGVCGVTTHCQSCRNASYLPACQFWVDLVSGTVVLSAATAVPTFARLSFWGIADVPASRDMSLGRQVCPVPIFNGSWNLETL